MTKQHTSRFECRDTAKFDEKAGGELKLLDVILNDVEVDVLSDVLGNKLVEVEVEFLGVELVGEEFKTLDDALADK